MVSAYPIDVLEPNDQAFLDGCRLIVDNAEFLPEAIER